MEGARLRERGSSQRAEHQARGRGTRPEHRASDRRVGPWARGRDSLSGGRAQGQRAGHKVRGRSTRSESGAPVERAGHQARGRSTRPEGEAPGQRTKHWDRWRGIRQEDRSTSGRVGNCCEVRAHGQGEGPWVIAEQGTGTKSEFASCGRTETLLAKKNRYQGTLEPNKAPSEVKFYLVSSYKNTQEKPSWSQMKGLMNYSSSTVLRKLVAEGKRVNMVCSWSSS